MLAHVSVQQSVWVLPSPDGRVAFFTDPAEQLMLAHVSVQHVSLQANMQDPPGYTAFLVEPDSQAKVAHVVAGSLSQQWATVHPLAGQKISAVGLLTNARPSSVTHAAAVSALAPSSSQCKCAVEHTAVLDLVVGGGAGGVAGERIR
jgi:hypothetical protein